jgi:hypothetical protein
MRSADRSRVAGLVPSVLSLPNTSEHQPNQGLQETQPVSVLPVQTQQASQLAQQQQQQVVQQPLPPVPQQQLQQQWQQAYPSQQQLPLPPEPPQSFANGTQLQRGQVPPPLPFLRAEDAWAEFEARLEADLATVGTTLVAIFGVIVFWRGVWSLLDYYSKWQAQGFAGSQPGSGLHHQQCRRLHLKHPGDNDWCIRRCVTNECSGGCMHLAAAPRAMTNL